MKLVIGIVLLAGAVAGQHNHDVNERGDHVMGFSHEKTTHHFRLYKDGGAIEVEANDGKDTQSRDQIRGHLTHIAKMFAEGNFNAPMLIHGEVPPGVPAMKVLREQILYHYEETAKGGRIRVTTTNSEAVAAVHRFLKFQITDHETGDSLAIQ